ncbi:MmgE/PrpD family protein [Rhodococcus sp. NPDC059968]|uniref:MmgE/PrpD family protein n=1 Tax=Rhodococcus sp. NPDC059968 TaxID=3347017 RepID=UPI00366F5982
MTIALALAEWAHSLHPTDTDLSLAQRSLVDTIAVTLAARDHPLVKTTSTLSELAHWASTGHVLDFDDLHMESTTHISVVIVPTVLAAGGTAEAYLAGAGVMARLGNALGWSHYARGWHATCTAGAPAAAVAASLSLGLNIEQTAHAISLAIPAAGGAQRAFGTPGKPLQVGFAAEAGLRAALLARAGARSDLRVVDDWLALVGARHIAIDTSGSAIPNGLAIKLFPCCYAMQRPIGAMRSIRSELEIRDIAAIRVCTPADTVRPLIHHNPTTGLEGKFSLEYALATALLDDFPGFASFTDAAVQRPDADSLVRLVTVELPETSDDNLLAGDVRISVQRHDGSCAEATLALPPGSPDLPPTPSEMAAKVASCGIDVPDLTASLTWENAAHLLRDQLPVLMRETASA